MFSWSTWFQLTDVENQLNEGIKSSKVGWWDMQVDLAVIEWFEVITELDV